MSGTILSVAIMALVLYAHPVSADDTNRLAAHLKRQFPPVTWKAASRLQVDINCDGIPDHVMLGRQGKKVVVAVVTGPLTKASRAHVESLFVGTDAQDSLCLPEVRLIIEHQDFDLIQILGGEPPGFRRSKTCKGFKIADDACDSFHFYWNHEANRPQWWRL